ncbi:Uncharacterised protein [Klebsiella aerogenes]|nr:Uncharacterised protein [Klebsiella aerogenes]
MVEQDRLFARLARSTFRSRFRLGVKERQYCLDKGPESSTSTLRILSASGWRPPNR